MKGMFVYRCGDFALLQSVATVYKAVYKAFYCASVAGYTGHSNSLLLQISVFGAWNLNFLMCNAILLLLVGGSKCNRQCGMRRTWNPTASRIQRSNVKALRMRRGGMRRMRT
jgi:hypothetical protein